MYNVFGSGANHGIYAQFMAQSALSNSGRAVGLLRGAGTRMALWFYAMMRLLRVRKALTATIHQQKFVDLSVKENVHAAVRDITDAMFWKRIYIVLRAVFPALRLLRYCDKSTPAMDKIYHLSHRTTVALEKSEQDLNDESLFGDMTSDSNLDREMDMMGVDGGVDDDDDDDVVFNNDASSSDDDSDDDDDVANGRAKATRPPKSFGQLFMWHWAKRKHRIEHEYAIAGWALCVLEDVRKDVLSRMNGDHQSAIDRVISRLHAPPCANTNPAVLSMTEADVLDTFWNEFKAYQNRTYPYDVASRWLSQDVVKGDSYLWHEKYSLRSTKVLGFVACRVTSKLCGIGAAERCWGGVKQIKTGKRSHLSGESTEKRSIIFANAKVTQGRMKSDRVQGLDFRGDNVSFGDDDINFNLELEKFGVDMEALKHVPIRRVFRAWVEDWEEEARKRNDAVDEAKLLAKYKGLVFRDPDNNNCAFKVWEGNMEYRSGRGGGWFLIAECNDDPENPLQEPFTLEIACELIGETEQEEGIQVIKQDGE